MNIFRGYEKFAGGDPDQLEVLIREDVLERYERDFGCIPFVEHAPLTHMVHDQANLSDIRRIKLYDGFLAGNEGSLKRWTLGVHLPASGTIHSAVGVNGTNFYLPRRESTDDYDPTMTMSKLIRNVVALNDVRHNRLACWYGRLAVLAPGDLVSNGYRQERRETEKRFFAEHKEDIRFKSQPSQD
jgi:hypothetical protein